MTPVVPRPDNGEVLRHWREARGYTQAELAEILEIAPETLSRIEHGKLRFRKVYGMACGWLDVHNAQHVHS